MCRGEIVYVVCLCVKNVEYVSVCSGCVLLLFVVCDMRDIQCTCVCGLCSMQSVVSNVW